MKKMIRVGMLLCMLLLGFMTVSFAKGDDDFKTTNEPNGIVYEERQVISGTAKRGTEIEFILTNLSDEFKGKGNLVEGDKKIVVGASKRFIKEFKLKLGENKITIKATYNKKALDPIEFTVVLKENDPKSAENAINSIKKMVDSLLEK